MASRTVDDESTENLEPWVTSLTAPGTSRDDILGVYSKWTENAKYESVSSFKLVIFPQPKAQGQLKSLGCAVSDICPL